MKRLLLLLFAIFPLLALAYHFERDGIYYNITTSYTDLTVSVTYESKNPFSGYYYSNYSGDIIIPESVVYNDKQYKVTGINECAFYNCKGLTSLIIPNSVTSIGSRAFYNCIGLTSLTISNCVNEIGKNAFNDCHLTNVNVNFITWDDNALAGKIFSESWKYYKDGEEMTAVVVPDSIKRIGDGAFYRCKSLVSITIPNSVTSIGSRAFTRCTGKLFVNCNIPDGWHDYDTNYLGSFVDADFSEVEIGNGVTRIGYYAFLGCSNLQSVIIPSTVTTIKEYAFSGCTGKLNVNCNIPSSSNSSLSTPRGTFSGSKFTEVENGKDVISIGNYAFYGCSGLTSVTIPNSVTNIGYKAFAGCTGKLYVNCSIDSGAFSESRFYDVEIGSDVTSVGDYAFNGCSGLTSVTIPNSVTNIGISAFYSCSALTSVNIPNSVTNIGAGAFHNCSGLTSVSIPNSVMSIGYEAFYGCTGRLQVNCNIPSESRYGLGTFYGSEFTEVEVGNDVTSVGDYAFYYNSSLINISILGSIKNIGNYAFKGCSSLKSIKIPSSVIKIGTEAFYGCGGLESVVVESGNKVYDSRDNCNAIIKTADNTLLVGSNNSIIPNDVTSIGDYAFYNCTGLTALNIPNSVTTIGDHAFWLCKGLTTISIPNSVKEIKDYAFRACESLTSVTVPNSVSNIKEGVFSHCIGLTSVSIPSSITNIGNYAFYHCSGLTSVSIPNSVTNIGNSAFCGCSGLTSVSIPNSIKRIEQSSFSWCTSLTSVNIPNSVKYIEDKAFGDCTGLQVITCKAKEPPYLSNNAFYHVNKSTCTLQVPAASVDAYFYADGWYEFVNIEAIKDPVSPIVDDGSEVTEQNAADITDFKLTLESGATFAANDGAKVELWIGGVLKGTAEKKDISLKDNVVNIKFTPVSVNSGARGMLGEFWNAVAATASDDVQVQVKVAANSFKVNGEDIADELSYTYTAKASVAEKIDQVLAIDEIDANSDNTDPVFNINGSRVNGNIQRGIIIKNGNKVLVK